VIASDGRDHGRLRDVAGGSSGIHRRWRMGLGDDIWDQRQRDTWSASGRREGGGHGGRRTEHDERRKGGGRDRQRKGGGPTCASHRRISHQQTPPPDRASVVVAGSRMCRSCSLSALTKSEGAPTLPDAEADGGRGRGWSIYGGEVEETGQVAAGVNQQEGIERGGPGGQP
jgi:hypothetical protein